jgi:hypothetical protein
MESAGRQRFREHGADGSAVSLRKRLYDSSSSRRQGWGDRHHWGRGVAAATKILVVNGYPVKEDPNAKPLSEYPPVLTKPASTPRSPEKG